MLSHPIILLALPLSSVAAWDTFNDWVNAVDKLDDYHTLASCAQPCVRDVNQRIPIDGTYCQTVGCVCSESTRGPNFLLGLSNVTECAKKACSNAEDAEAAELAYQDICLVYAASSSRPNKTEGTNITRITADGYADLSPCAKFALNGCLNENGTRDEANCGPNHKYENWELYRGVADQRKCHNSECICKQPKFDASFAVAFDAGESFCGMRLSTVLGKDEEYERMQNVLAMYCTAAGYPPKEWVLQIIGKPQNSTNSTSSSSDRDRDDEWTLSNKLQIGLGLGLGFPALLINIGLLWLAWWQFRSFKNALEEKME